MDLNLLHGKRARVDHGSDVDLKHMRVDPESPKQIDPNASKHDLNSIGMKLDEFDVGDTVVIGTKELVILRMAGRGDNGKAYLVHDFSGQRQILKISRQLRYRYHQRSVEALKRLDRLVAEEYFPETKTSMIVQTYIPGNTFLYAINQIVDRKDMQHEKKKQWLFELRRAYLQGLDDLHRQGVVHRDAHPKNAILQLTEAGEFLPSTWIDFDTARMTFDARKHESELLDAKARFNGVAGLKPDE